MQDEDDVQGTCGKTIRFMEKESRTLIDETGRYFSFSEKSFKKEEAIKFPT
jgi:hypothetical protein